MRRRDFLFATRHRLTLGIILRVNICFFPTIKRQELKLLTHFHPNQVSGTLGYFRIFYRMVLGNTENSIFSFF